MSKTDKDTDKAIDEMIETWGKHFEPATSTRGQGGLPLHGSVVDWKLTLTKDGWNFHKKELKQAIKQLLAQPPKVDDKAIEDVLALCVGGQCSHGAYYVKPMELKQLLAQRSVAEQSKQADYNRLKNLELQGIRDYRKMRKAPTLSPEAVVSFINQLSPWNLKTTGISILEAYFKKQNPIVVLPKSPHTPRAVRQILNRLPKNTSTENANLTSFVLGYKAAISDVAELNPNSKGVNDE